VFLVIQRLVNFCWFCFKWGLVLGAMGVAASVPWLYRRVDEEVRRQIEARIAEHYPGLKITVRSAALVEEEGIELRGLSVFEPGAEGPCAELVYFDECFLACRTDWQELLGGQPQVTRVTIRRPILRVTRRPDGCWSASRLLPLPRLSTHPPQVAIESGTIEIFDPLKNPSSTLTLRDVNLLLVPPAAMAGGLAAPRQLRGTASGDHFRQMVVEGVVDPERQQWSIGGSVEGLEISPALREALPASLATKLADLGNLHGQGDFTFRVAYEPPAAAGPASAGDGPDFRVNDHGAVPFAVAESRTGPTAGTGSFDPAGRGAAACSSGVAEDGSPLRFELSGRFARGRIDHPRLPHPLTDIQASVRLSNAGFAVDGLVARSNQASLRMSCRRAGHDKSSPMFVEAEIRQLELDRRLQEVLPERLGGQWYKYLPSGQVDADAKLRFDGSAWHPEELTVRCLDISFSHHEFPYRLDHGKGTIELKNEVLQLRLQAYSGMQPVHVAARILHPLSAPSGWCEAKGDDLPLDAKLLDALRRPTRAVVASLAPRGSVNFQARWWRDAPQQPLRHHLLVRLNHCGMCYDQFRYPLVNVRGDLEMLDGVWSFRNLEGANDTGRIHAEGHLRPTPQGKELCLQLTGRDVPLDEDLHDALRPNLQQVWNSLRPRGIIDLGAEIRFLPEQQKLSVAVTVRPQSESTSIEPVQFPYRTEKLQGVLVYRDGRVTFDRLKSEHGPVRLAAGGYCEFLPDGCWHLHLEGLSIDRLRLDRELVQALPARLRKPLVELDPNGPVNVNGRFDLVGGPSPGDALRAQWDLRLGLHQASVDCGVRLRNIHGSLTLTGRFDGQQFQSRGELALDSAHYKDYQFTNIMGPLWIDDQQVLLGSWVGRSQVAAPPRDDGAGRPAQRPLTARLFGGTVYGDVWIALAPVARYGVQATLADADLALAAQEVMAGQQNLRGKVIATVDLRGSGRSRNALGGRGTIRLREADVYELPLMISLLKILSNSPPNRTAFSKSDVDFRIEGEHIYFDRIDFSGDAISLLGKGEMDFESNIRLTFGAIVGRGELNLPILREIVGGASKQIMTIRVSGSLQNPETRKEAFPGVNQVLQQLQEDLQRNRSSTDTTPQARQGPPWERR